MLVLSPLFVSVAFAWPDNASHALDAGAKSRFLRPIPLPKIEKNGVGSRFQSG